MAIYSYPLTLKELSGGRVCVNFPDIKGLSIEADSITEACNRVKEKLINHIVNTTNNGDKLPKLMPLSCLKMNDNKLIILIDLEI